MTRIDANAFYHDSSRPGNIKKLRIGKGLTTIGSLAFHQQTKLEEVVFEEDDETSINNALALNNYIFSYCSSLKTLTLPKRCTVLGLLVNNYAGIETIIVPDGSKLTTIDGTNLKNSLKTVTFQGTASNLKTISNAAFANYTALESLHLPGSVTTIAPRAFDGCVNLTDLTFGSQSDPSQIKTIGEMAFYNCGITTFDVPASVESIGREAFLGCTDLEEVTIGSALTSLDPEAFKGCTSLRAYHVDEANPNYADIDGYLTDKSKTTLLAYPQGKATGDAFTLMPPSLTAIGRYAFYDNDKVTRVMLPAGITSIGARAFGNDFADTGTDYSLIMLGSSLVDPDNISQGINDMSFNYPGTNEAITNNALGNITLSVTKTAYAQWQQAKTAGAGDKYYDFYSKFKDIQTTFTEAHGSTAAEEDEFMPVSGTAVALLSTGSTADTYIVPTEIEHGGSRYSVDMINDFAMENASTAIKEVVIKSKPAYIGSLAFANNITRDGSGNVTGAASTVESIVFVSSTPAEQLASEVFQLSDNYKEFTAGQKIYVKRSAKDAYKTAWAKYADQIETDIPMKAVSNQYGTFTREFDIDLNPGNENWSASRNMPKLTAFTAGAYGTRTGSDGQQEYVVRMRSINEGQSGIDGTYVPANTGVLIVATEGSTTEGSLKYTIGERDLESYSGENLMQPVCEKGISSLAATGSGGATNFYVGGGKLWPVQAAIDKHGSLSMPVHTSYLSVQVPQGVSASKVVFTFSDFSETTGISELTIANGASLGATAAAEPAYNLSGQRVGESYKGLVISKGKKEVRR